MRMCEAAGLPFLTDTGWGADRDTNMTQRPFARPVSKLSRAWGEGVNKLL